MVKVEKMVEQAKVHLEPQETIRGAVLGAYETTIMGNNTVRNGVLLATDRRVVFYSKRLSGYDMESFPYGNISSFEQGKNMMGHNVTLYASGNKVHVKWIVSLPDLQNITAVVKQAMNAKHVQPSPMTAPNESQTIMEQIKQLGELRDNGILTETEFTTKKTELLARL
jgi:hypothetical protein